MVINTPTPRRRSWGLWLLATGVYLFLYAPLLIVVLFSFNRSRLGTSWTGFTLDWYRKLFANESLQEAALNSLIVALLASGVATVLGTLAGMAMHRYRLRLLPVLVLTPVAVPEILMGLSLLLFFVALDVTLGMVSMILSHVVFCLGFVAVVVRSRLAAMDPALIEAARDLGASPWQAFRWVVLPDILPGVVAGALMAFTLSIDDFVITFFTAGAGTVTLPLQIYSMLKITVTPEVNAVSTLLMLVSLGLVLLVSRLAPGSLKQT